MADKEQREEQQNAEIHLQMLEKRCGIIGREGNAVLSGEQK